MTDYTPTTEEMRDAFCALQSFGSEAARNRSALFDRWLAAQAAEAAANALRDAAAAMDADDEFRDPLRLKSEWVRNRADRIEREATNHEQGNSERTER